MVSDHSTGRIPELQLLMAPQLSLQTPNTNTASENNHQASPFIVSRHPHDNSDALRPHVIEITTGSDVFERLFDIAHRLGRSLCILSGNGVVEDVMLRTATGMIVTLHGRFQIIHLSGTIMSPQAPSSAKGLSAHLSATTGERVWGTVMAPMVALSPMVLVAASFQNIAFERLPLVANDPDEHEPAGLDAAGQVAENGDLVNVVGSTNGMNNNINDPSSSDQGRILGETTAT